MDGEPLPLLMLLLAPPPTPSSRQCDRTTGTDDARQQQGRHWPSSPVPVPYMEGERLCRDSHRSRLSGYGPLIFQVQLYLNLGVRLERVT